MASRPPVLILTGFGLNCEAESRYAWERAGAAPELVHLNDLLAAPGRLMDFQALMFIGGFSFGDHMGSGHVLALRLRHRVRDALRAFLDRERLVMGVCNGFQTMVKLGLLPGFDGDYFTQKMAMAANDCGVFQNFWVNVRFERESPCVFTRGLTSMPLPIRHGEGKVFALDRAILERVEREHCVACRYADPATGDAARRFPHNPNGSLNAIAGLCDPSGRVFGLMPHPEAFLFPENRPNWDARRLSDALPGEGDGLQIFRNAVEFMR